METSIRLEGVVTGPPAPKKERAKEGLSMPFCIGTVVLLPNQQLAKQFLHLVRAEVELFCYPLALRLPGSASDSLMEGDKLRVYINEKRIRGNGANTEIFSPFRVDAKSADNSNPRRYFW